MRLSKQRLHVLDTVVSKQLGMVHESASGAVRVWKPSSKGLNDLGCEAKKLRLSWTWSVSGAVVVFRPGKSDGVSRRPFLFQLVDRH